MYRGLTVRTEEADIAAAVLIRAGEPVKGIESMRRRRPKTKRDSDLLSGPGKLCIAMDIDRRLDGEPLDGDRLFLTSPDVAIDESEIAVSTRIGVEGAVHSAHWPLRFFLRGNPNLSSRP